MTIVYDRIAITIVYDRMPRCKAIKEYNDNRLSLSATKYTKQKATLLRPQMSRLTCLFEGAKIRQVSIESVVWDFRWRCTSTTQMDLKMKSF